MLIRDTLCVLDYGNKRTLAASGAILLYKRIERADGRLRVPHAGRTREPILVSKNGRKSPT